MEPSGKAIVIEKANARRYAISDSKGVEYSGREDVLRNFKSQGERLNLSEVVVLGVYFGKHIDSIETFMRDLPKCKSYAARVALVNHGEGIISRLDDARNYLDLLECLLVDLELHPDGVNQEEIARHEIMELAERIDWTQPGLVEKGTTGPCMGARDYPCGQPCACFGIPSLQDDPFPAMPVGESVSIELAQATRSDECRFPRWRKLRFRVHGSDV